MLSFWKNPLKALPVLLLLATYAGAAFGVAGNVQFVVGDVKLITRTGETRALAKGADVNEGDRIVTAASASAQIKMIDGGLIAIRPSTDMGFDNYRYSGKEDGTENAIVSLLRGGFRTITGIIGRTNKHNYLIRTETATIGIRGTDHEPFVILAPAPGQVAIAPPGTYDKVNVGVAFIRTDAGSVDIQRNQVGFAPITKAAPVILPKIPPFYKPTPAPGPQKAKEEAKDEGKKEGQQAAAAPAKAGEEQKAAAPAEKAAEPIRNTAVVDPASTVATTPATAPAAAPTAIAPVVAITATDASGATLNTTSQTVTSSTGTTLPVTQAATAPPPPVYAPQAQAAADAALVAANSAQTTSTAAAQANTTLSAIAPVNTVPASNAITAANSAISTASPLVSSVTALAPANATTAAANAAAVQTAASTAASLATAAASAFAANGSFADVTAVAANAAAQTANNAIITASTSVQAAATAVTTQNTALSTAQTAASGALTSAGTNATTASGALTSANTQNAAISAAQTAAAGLAAQVQAAVTTAQAAANAATAAAAQAASLEAKGDLTGAAAQLAIAQQQQTIAQQQQATAQSASASLATQLAAAQAAQTAASTAVTNAASAANNAATLAGTAQTQASAAQAAAASAAGALAQTAVATAGTPANAVQTQADIVAANAPIAVYNNPAVAGNFLGATMFPVATSGGFNDGFALDSRLQSNTTYVLNGSGNLVEARNLPFVVQANPNGAVLTPLITGGSGADIKWSGGTAADAFKLADNSIYGGRWVGATVTVTDNSNPTSVFTYTPANSLWAVLMPPSPAYMQSLVGTSTYAVAGHTTPVDAFGNLGTLNSASLAANFTTQKVDAAVNLTMGSGHMAGTFDVSASAMSINATTSVNPSSFGVPNASALTTTCTGACAAGVGGYSADIGGSFAGTKAASAGLSYNIWPTTTSTTAPASDSVQGLVAFTTATAPAVGTAAVLVPGGTGKFRQRLYLPQTVGNYTYASVYSLGSGVTTGAQNYSFDASGNLVRIQSTDYMLSNRGRTDPPSYSSGAFPYTGTLDGLPSSPLTGISAAISGVSTPDGTYNDAVNGIRLGRYAGGTIVTTDVSNPANPLTYYTPLGNNSLSWVVREIPPGVPVTGSFDYKPTYSTKPTDSLGNVGVLNYASLSANFTTQTVNPAVGITISNQTLSSAATNVPIDSQFGFDVSSNSQQNLKGGGVLRVSCYGSNCAPAPVGINVNTNVFSYIYTGYGGRITGALAGPGTAGGAFFSYNFNTYYNSQAATGSAGGLPSGETRPVDDYVGGLVAFTKGADLAAFAPSTATSGSQVFRTAYVSLPLATGGLAQGWTGGYRVSPTSYTSPFGTAATNSIGDPSGTGSWETLAGGTIALAPSNADSFAATGISFGRYTGGTLTGVDGQGAFTRANIGDYSWIKGPTAAFQTAAMTASARYKLDGGTATFINGSTGNTNANTVTSAVLAVNFSAAAVGVEFSTFGVSTVGGASHTWAATTTSNGVLTGSPATTLRLGNGGGFYASSWNTSNPALHESLYVTHDGSAPNANGIGGQLNGQLMGYNLSGAGLTYSLQNTPATGSGGSLNGSVAFALESYTSTPTPNNTSGSATLTQTTTTGTSAIDMNSTPYQIHLSAAGLIANPGATPANAPASVDSQYLTRVVRQANNTGRLVLGAEGLPITWDGQRLVTNAPSCSPSPCPAYVIDAPARVSIDSSSFVATGATPGSGQVALPAGKTPATLAESGLDAATGLRWGRYAGGVIAYFDRIGGTSTSIWDVTNQNLHTILGSTQTGPITLPVTGTFAYTNVGGTKPTDNLGSAAGTLNSATLVANFSAQTVDTGVNLTVNGQTWAAGATAVPIQQSGQFVASRDFSSGSGNLNVCTGGSCGTTTLPTASSANTAGTILGSFTGSSGQGAGIAYSLNQGGLAGTTVSGVAVFKR